MALHESAEMYLETIYCLAKERGAVRSVDVAVQLGYSKPSVSRAVGLLKQGGYLTMDAEGFLVLTQQGIDTASRVFERHTVITALLRRLGVSEETADADACRIEHVISDETLDAVRKFMAE